METDPATIDEAFLTVAEYSAREERRKRVMCKGFVPTTEEEPIEVGAVAAKATAHNSRQ